MKNRFAFGLILPVLLGSCAQSPKQPRLVKNEEDIGDYEHPNTKIKFPGKLAGFQRMGVMEFQQSPSDVGVEYLRVQVDGPIQANIYLYPRPAAANASSENASKESARLLGIQLEGIKNEMLKRPEMKFIDEEKGKRVSFQYEGFFGGEKQLLALDIYLFKIGDTYVKYRFNYPEKFKSIAPSEIERFLVESKALIPQ